MTAGPTREDRRWMELALRLARRGKGRTRANPAVGAVLVRDGVCVGAGYHTWAGRRHAEAWALDRAGTKARGATCYVTLEPCAHKGRTPPCAEALRKAGVSRVVYGSQDPVPHAAGAGPSALSGASIDVEGGCLRDRCDLLIEEYLHAALTGRPLVTAKAACGPDGRLATAGGESKWLSGESSRRLYRRERGRYDAVLVGARTARLDDPHLGASPEAQGDEGGPLAVVLDGALDAVSTESRLAQRAGEGGPVLVCTREGAPTERRAALEAAGIDVVEIAAGAAGDGLDPRAALGELFSRGCRSVLVEGGGALLSSWFDARLVDRVLLFQAPRMIGGREAPQIWAGTGSSDLQQAPTLERVDRFLLGGDEVLESRVVWPARLI